MLQPVGPLPASVYWRRRAVALGLVLLAILLLWAVWPGGGDGDRRNAAATTGTATPTPGEIVATPPANDPGRAADPPAGTSPAGPAGTGGSAGPAGPASTTPAPPPPAPPKPCSDRQLQLRVAPQQPAYAVGTEPRITLSVRNVSPVRCTRDLGAALQEIRLYRGTTRLWSSNDCYPEGERAPTLLRSGGTAASSVTWSGLSSRPGCAGTRTRVPAGTYTLVGRLGTLTSPHATLTLR